MKSKRNKPNKTKKQTIFVAKAKLMLVVSLIACFSFSTLAFASPVCVNDGLHQKICKDDWKSLALELSSRLEKWKERGVLSIKKIKGLQANLSICSVEKKASEEKLTILRREIEQRELIERIKDKKKPIHKCPRPIAEYITIAALGASVIGVGIGAFYLGKNLK